MARYGRLIDGNLEYMKTYKGGILVDGMILYNATEDTFNDNGWFKVEDVEENGTDHLDGNVIKHYVGEPQTYEQTYEERVVELIRGRYSIDDELAILRQKDSKADEYEEYFAFCESCKAQAREEAV